jgi:hypothetical protein
MLVIISLMAFGFGSPAMARGGSSDRTGCMAMMQSAQMMQSEHATPHEMPASGKPCPLADLRAATAGFFVEPAPAFNLISHDPIEVALIPFDDEFGDGLTPIPPSRPPRA